MKKGEGKIEAGQGKGKDDGRRATGKEKVERGGYLPLRV